MKKMIAFCGLDCEKCDAYLATINQDSDAGNNPSALNNLQQKRSEK